MSSISFKEQEQYLEWDYYAWGKALQFWDSVLPDSLASLKILEIGARSGSLCLYFAQKGGHVICSDIKDNTTLKYSSQYFDEISISFEKINATIIPYSSHFDIVVIKSVLGGIGEKDKLLDKQKVISEIFKCLKPDGIVLFAENAKGSFLHRYLRKYFRSWGKRWTYLSITDLQHLFHHEGFTVKIKSFGYLSVLVKDKSRFKYTLYLLDKFLAYVIPASSQYIVFGYARKK